MILGKLTNAQAIAHVELRLNELATSLLDRYQAKNIRCDQQGLRIRLCDYYFTCVHIID